ncbi:MAG: hypothetical protein Q9195_003124 [Heterodermia aff. obscurata]
MALLRVPLSITGRQAAYISTDPAAYSNPFFNSTPPGMFYPSLVIAILAAVVASQTMITAVFQLLSQIIKLSYFPQIKVVHTSKIFRGQIYIPSFGPDGSTYTGSNSSPRPSRLAPKLGGSIISPIKGLGIFFDKTGDPIAAPVVFVNFLQKFQATPAVAVFFHIRPISNPTVEPEARFTISRCFPDHNAHPLVQNFFRVTLRHGYTDEVVTPDLGMVIYEEIRKFIIRENVAPKNNVARDETSSSEQADSGGNSSPSGSTEHTEARQRQLARHSVQERLNNVEAAYEDQVTYIVGKEQMRIREGSHATDWARRTVLAAFLWLRANTGSKVANLTVDVDKLVEIGFVKVV